MQRKLRSINALSCASAYHLHNHSIAPEKVPNESVSVPAPSHPIFKKCSSIDAGAAGRKLATSNDLKPTASIDIASKDISVVPASSNTQEIPKIPMPPSKNPKPDSSNAATSPPKVVSPQPVVHNDGQAQPTAPISINEDPSSGALSPVNSGVASVPESSNHFASPRPSIDTIVQVHRSSVDEEKSDSDAPQQDEDTDNDMEGIKDEDPRRTRSLSNEE